VQKLGPWEAGATLSGEGSLTIGAPAAGVAVAAPAGNSIVSADTGAAAESLGVVRQGDVDDLSGQASRGGLAARLSANQRILLAVILIAAVFPVLPPEWGAGNDGPVSTAQASSFLNAAVLPDPRAERRRRLAGPGLEFRAFCTRRRLPASSTPQLERAWDAWQAGRYQRGEIAQRPGYTHNPFRPR